jgi:ubiquinone/menaquinone biosynthesis C-methylase UbiE
MSKLQEMVKSLGFNPSSTGGSLMSQLKVDFGLTARDYAAHRAGFPDSLFQRLAERGIGQPGQVVVDLGTGTGTLARGFALRGCKVTGIDVAEPLLQEARRLSRRTGIEIEFRFGRAEATGLPARFADVVTAGQCWHWFDSLQAAREVARILKPEGFLIIAHFDWLPLKGNVVEATEQLILQHNLDWTYAGTTGIHPQWLRDLGETDFRNLETFSYDVEVPYTPADWRGRIRASSGVGASLPAAQVEDFDYALAAILKERFPGEVLRVPHRVFTVIARPPQPAHT